MIHINVVFYNSREIVSMLSTFKQKRIEKPKNNYVQKEKLGDFVHRRIRKNNIRFWHEKLMIVFVNEVRIYSFNLMQLSESSAPHVNILNKIRWI